ncbi:MAG: DNA-3-methyladenine glycosylase family protein [Eubacteriales bacterium]
MEYIKEENAAFETEQRCESGLPVLEVRGVNGFSVQKTFDCGQCFRFDPVEGTPHETEYGGAALGRFFSVAQDGDTITVYNCDKKFFCEKLVRFLSLDVDYDSVRREIQENCPTEYIKKVTKLGYGLRILRQEKWETLCSFIISQNNNIPRIKKLVRALAAACGSELDVSHMQCHGAEEKEFAFPSPYAVCALGADGLRELRTGFRAKYIYDAAEKVSSGELDLEKTAALDTDACIESLCGVKGVGLKVASCAALFGMEKYDAFPIDVWIRRTLDAHFPPDFEPEKLGRFAGIAQQYMFYSARYLDE